MIMINNNLRIFIQVAEKGSFTLVANERFISQPAVSRAIKALEDELNVKLFYRDKRNGLILTDAGNNILHLAIQMEDLENRIYQTAYRDNHFLGGKARIASLPILTSVILSKAFSRFHNQYPDVTIELVEGSSQEIRKAVEDHQVDFGLTCTPFGDLDFISVFNDRILSVEPSSVSTNQSYPLLNTTNRYIMCEAVYETLMEKLKSQKINLENSFVVQQAETVINLVNQGNGVGVISELVLNATPNNLVRHEVIPPVELEIGLVANDLNDLTPVASKLLETTLEVCKEYAVSNGSHVNHN
ncbi:MAG: LysR family transcriptional regulator [Solobacterium sp.]|nr:LysR family transcriptional regulator [Solobacterium sp.]